MIRLVAVSLLAAGLGLRPSAATHLVALNVDGAALVLSANECTLSCYQSDCAPGWHDAFQDPDAESQNASWNGGPHNDIKCYSGTCPAAHGPMCDGLLASLDVEVLQHHLARRDAKAVEVFLDANKGFAWLNVDRSAIQIGNCEGATIGHLPITEEILATLVAAE